MANEIIIRCTYGTKVDFPLKGRFFDKTTKKQIILLHGFKVAVNRELTTTERELRHIFTPDKRELSLVWDNTELEKAEFAKWVKQHPQVNHPDNKNKDPQTYFQLVDKSRQDEIQYNLENGKVVAYNKAKNMPTSELMEVAFYSLISDPSKMTPLQLFNQLFGLNNGIIMQNPYKFLEEWSLPDRSMRVIIRKAILLNLIESQDGVFTINKNTIGSQDNLVVYLKDNKQYYSYLEKELATRDTLPYGVTADISVEEALALEKPKEKKDRTLPLEKREENKMNREVKAKEDHDVAQRDKYRLKELGVKGWQASESWSPEVRAKRIADAEKATADQTA